MKKFPNDFTTIDLKEKYVHNADVVNGFVKEVVTENNDTEIIIRDGLVVFKKGENIFVVTSDQIFVSTED